MIDIKNVYVLQHLLYPGSEFHSLKSSRVIIIAIAFSAIEDLKSEYLKIATTQTYPPFSVYFDIQPSNENLSWLCRFVLLPSYVKEKGNVRIFANGSCKDFIRRALDEQGFPDADIVDFEDFEKLVAGNLSGFILVRGNLGYCDLVIAATRSFAEMGQDNCLKQNSWLQKLLEYEPNRFGTAKKIMQQNVSLRNQVSELLTELQNQKEYLEIALRQKETESILNFYHSEYEVLPLWYKRFGHVIKILMGKRKIKQ
jgi:hypothetical protein